MVQLCDFAELHLRVKAPNIVAYDPPIEWAHVWECYTRLSHTRQTGMAANPITYVEIEAFCRIQRVSLEPWEADALIMVDGIFRAASQKDGKGEKVEHKDAASVKDMMSGVRRKRTVEG